MNHTSIRFNQAILYVSPYLRESLELLPESEKQAVTEIRLRGGKPLVIATDRGCFVLQKNGQLSQNSSTQDVVCSFECLEQTFRAICGYSIHTHQQEMLRGYITLKGGHRAGLGATAVEKDGCVTSVKEISSICLRIAKQVFGVADDLVEYANRGGLLLVGCPGSGKTTVLRDLTRQLAGVTSPGKRVTVIDERGELAAVWDGLPQNEIGLNADVLNGFSKSAAMEMAIRSLSPDVIVCDEIGSRREAEEILNCTNAGVKVIASTHAGSIEELKKKHWIMPLIRAGVFQYIVLLNGQKGKGTIERIYQEHELVFEGNRNHSSGDSAELVGDFM